MIIKYDFRKILKDRGISSTYIAKKLGISRQLFLYYTKKGDMPVSYTSIIAEEIGVPLNKMLKSCERCRIE